MSSDYVPPRQNLAAPQLIRSIGEEDIADAISDVAQLRDSLQSVLDLAEYAQVVIDHENRAYADAARMLEHEATALDGHGGYSATNGGQRVRKEIQQTLRKMAKLIGGKAR